jgi:hypothetical protein
MTALGRAGVFFVATSLILAAAGTLRATEQLKATTSAAARADAAKAIPLDKIDATARKTVAEVVSKAGIFRRMPIAVAPCDPTLYRFMVCHPEVIVNIWEVMGVAKVTMQPVGAGAYRAADGAGTLCDVQFVYSEGDTHVILADGAYTGQFFIKPVKAKCVLLLKSGFVRESNGQNYVTSRMDSFIHVENAGIDLVARTVHPLVGKAADHNFTETAAFLSCLSRSAQRNQPGVQRLAAKLNKIDPATRDAFSKIVAAIPPEPAERTVATDSAVAGRMK